jgi:hypothetical protein
MSFDEGLLLLEACISRISVAIKLYMLPVHEDAKMQSYDHDYFRKCGEASQCDFLFTANRTLYICI